MQFRLRLRFALADLRVACDLSLAISARDAISRSYDAAELPADHSAAPLGVERRVAGDPVIQAPCDSDAGAISSYGVRMQP